MGTQLKLLKKHMISAYTKVAELVFPVISQGRLAVSDKNEMCKSLNDCPFIDLALTTLTSKLYHDYCPFLAPLEGALTLVLLRYFHKHIFLRGVVATPPLNLYNEPPYTPICGTNG